MRKVSARPTTDTATYPSGTDLSGTDLVNAARSGDPRAQAALFSEYLPLVYNVVGRGLHGQLPSTPFLSNTKNPTIGATLTS